MRNIQCFIADNARDWSMMSSVFFDSQSFCKFVFTRRKFRLVEDRAYVEGERIFFQKGAKNKFISSYVILTFIGVRKLLYPKGVLVVYFSEFLT